MRIQKAVEDLKIQVLFELYVYSYILKAI